MEVINTIDVTKRLLKAYVLAKSGSEEEAGEMFAEVAQDEDIDPVMDGIAKSVQELESGADDSTDDTEEDNNPDEGTSKDPDADEEDQEDDVDMGNDNSTDDKESKDVEVPASVADVLNLEY